MTQNLKSYHRRSIRLPGYDYSLNGSYFVTVCSHDKKCVFGHIGDNKMVLNNIGLLVEKQWLALPEKYTNISLDAYVVMPNHFHGIVTIDNPVAYRNISGAIHELPLHANLYERRPMLLSKIIGYFKMNSAKQINIIQNTQGQPVWQRNYYEHVIRNEKSIQTIYDYIQHNPENWEKDKLFSLI